jgi:4'-phosphopantetheinyl transferase
MHCGVEVWTARPDRLGDAACGELEGLLDPQERMRVARFRLDTDRRAFVAAHAMRRIALGLALSVDPQDLRFSTGPHGRPTLQGMDGGPPFFSLTRSRGLVALAISARGSVGIDVEPLQPGCDASLLAPFMASTAASEGLDFHLRWTALEAYWKARGLGLSTEHPRIGLRSVDGDELFEVVWGDAIDETAGYVVIRLPAPEGHVLCLACEEAGPVRMVALESLALAPSSDGFQALARARTAPPGPAPGGTGEVPSHISS